MNFQSFHVYVCNYKDLSLFILNIGLSDSVCSVISPCMLPSKTLGHFRSLIGDDCVKTQMLIIPLCITGAFWYHDSWYILDNRSRLGNPDSSDPCTQTCISNEGTQFLNSTLDWNLSKQVSEANRYDTQEYDDTNNTKINLNKVNWASEVALNENC